MIVLIPVSGSSEGGVTSIGGRTAERSRDLRS